MQTQTFAYVQAYAHMGLLTYESKLESNDGFALLEIRILGFDPCQPDLLVEIIDRCSQRPQSSGAFSDVLLILRPPMLSLFLHLLRMPSNVAHNLAQRMDDGKELVNCTC